MMSSNKKRTLERELELFEQLREVTHLDKETGILTWSRDIGRKIKCGRVVGHTNTQGYRVGRFNRQAALIHRFIFWLCHGHCPLRIDHINGVKDDNRPVNLREANASQNAMNAGKRIDNESGYRGVSWYRPLGKWKASICVNYRTHHLGYFTDITAAVAARQAAEVKHFGDYRRVA